MTEQSVHSLKPNHFL